ncbi:hypothetical protein BpHYR1_049460 [Brachionus plicatilis]|uniref:Uncharacterized protein n=1 Tax=Brachionus plicatilis TaxID=10195 RepID=A0A3M7R298_BRAPC|nr:hypothetical protein BpHYR1_049460 [Brachionus plicatilis]
MFAIGNFKMRLIVESQPYQRRFQVRMKNVKDTLFCAKCVFTFEKQNESFCTILYLKNHNYKTDIIVNTNL